MGSLAGGGLDRIYDAVDTLESLLGGTGALNGAILDGVSSSIKATVFDYTNANPLAVVLRDTNGDYVSVGGGTQYTEDAAAAANPVGTAVNLIRQDTPGALVTTDGDNVAQRGTNYGAGYVQVVTSVGAFVDTFGGGTQYADGAARGTATGTLALGDDGTNIQSVHVDSSGDLQIDILTMPSVAVTNAGITTIAGAVSGTEMQVDVLTMPTVAVTGTFWQATQPVSGTFWQATQPVSGTVTANMGTVTVDPFGANADAASATGSISAKLRFIASTGIPITGTVMVDSHAVTNAGTFAVQAVITAASGSIVAGAVAAGATSFVKLEDVGSADADAGVPAMAVQKATPANTAGTDGDYEFLQMSAGRVWTSTNVDKINGVAPLMGVGVTGTGAQRIVLANDHGKTLVSMGGSAASNGNNTLIAAGTNRLKVYAFSLSTLSTTAVTCIFQSGAGGTELWRVVLQAPASTGTGANLVVSPPAWLFATASATLLNLNLSSAQTVHWAASYYDEA